MRVSINRKIEIKIEKRDDGIVMIRVLHCVNNMHRAGLETMLMNYYKNIDRTKIQFDFLTHRPEKSDYDDEIIAMGGRVYHAPRLYPQNYPAYFKYMGNFFSEHPEYKIIHSHIDTMSYLPLLAAEKAGVPIRIAHSHSTSIDKDLKYLLKKYFKSRLNDVATERLACGNEAGKFLFKNKKYMVIPNAVEAKKFHFNSQIRNTKRLELGIVDKFVIGHVGRISYPKNQKFLIDIFKEVLKMDSTAILLIIGVGEKEKEIKQYVFELGLTSKVHFLGNRNDVFELYQAMDVFVLPSLFEGVPLVGVEAQFSDLPCFFSDKVPVEVAFNENCKFIKLEESANEWAIKIIDSKKYTRTSNQSNIINNYYDIKVAHEILEDYYLRLK